MAVTTEQRSEAIKGTNKKTVLANALERKISAWNNKLIAFFRKNYPVNQVPTILSEDLENILTEHYLKTAEVFSLVDLKKGVIKQTDQEINRIEAEVAKKVLKFIDDEKDIHIQSIITTTDNILSETIKKAQIIAQEENQETPTVEEIALIAALLLKKRLSGRLPVIGVTETNWPAEGTKFTQTQAIKDPMLVSLNSQKEGIEFQNESLALDSAIIAAGIAEFSNSESVRDAGKQTRSILKLPASVGVAKLTDVIKKVTEALKVWIDTGDNRVRPGHNASQVSPVKESQPFVVNGELLMYPTDSSLGASLDNTIN